MADALRRALERKLAASEKAGLTEHADRTRARLAALDKRAALHEGGLILSDSVTAAIIPAILQAGEVVLSRETVQKLEVAQLKSMALTGLTKAELLSLAAERGIEVKKSMNKAELVERLTA